MTALFLLQVFITVITLLSSVYVVLSSRYDRDAKNWAMASIGGLILFWLR